MFRYVRSSGPGGQNVNKVNSKAVLRWSLDESTSIQRSVRERFRGRYGSRLTVRGEVVLSSDRFRDRSGNRDACLEQLERMLASVAHPPRRRKKTKPTRASVERRLNEKKGRSARKKERRRPDGD